MTRLSLQYLVHSENGIDFRRIKRLSITPKRTHRSTDLEPSVERMRVVPRRTVVGDIDQRFDNLSG